MHFVRYYPAEAMSETIKLVTSKPEIFLGNTNVSNITNETGGLE